MVLGRAGKLAIAGVAGGLVASAGLTRLMTSMLCGVKARTRGHTLRCLCSCKTTSIASCVFNAFEYFDRTGPHVPANEARQDVNLIETELGCVRRSFR